MAVVDSIYDIPAATKSDFRVVERKNFIASTENDTTTHGSEVLDVLTYFAPDATYNFYRIVTDAGEFKEGNLLKAFAAARDRGVDVVNLSAGIHHENCSQRCRVCHAANELTDDGVLIVAGAGNETPGESKSIFCPAAHDSVVSVGQYVAKCAAEPPGHRRHPTLDLLDTPRPPGAYAVVPDDDVKCLLENEYEYETGSFCGERGCFPGYSCRDHRELRLWEHNVSRNTRNIDVFAPGHYLRQTPEGPFIVSGTSYATAIVSGAVVDVLSRLFDVGRQPTGLEIARAIVKGGNPVWEAGQRFNSTNVYALLE